MEDIVNSFKKRIVEDEFEIDGRTFKLKSYDPLIGNYILFKILTAVLPFGIGDKLAGETGVETVTTSTKMMTKPEFVELQRDVLSNCYEVLPAGEAQVVRENGTYGVSNFTSTIALQLIIASLAFNYKDFFAEFLSKGEFTLS